MVAASGLSASQQNPMSDYMAQWNPASVLSDRSNTRSPTPWNGTSTAQLSAEYYQADSLSVTYTNKDGDSVSLDMKSVEYMKTSLTASGSTDSSSWQKIVEFMKEQFKQLQAELVKTLTDGIDGKKSDAAGQTDQTPGTAQPALPTQDTAKSDAIPGLPDYWNAENTAQRIVDFATSFFGLNEGSNSDFFKMIRDAIEEGFKQAGDQMSDMPDAVKKLTSDTHDLVLKKLDDWAKAQGIDDTQLQDANVQAAA
jgi:hypothetical protein